MIAVSSESCPEVVHPALRAGIEQFNRGEFSRSHETLERLWMAESRPIRRFYQGILQIGVALHHLGAGRYRPAVTLLERGSSYVRGFAPVCLGVNVDRLLADTARCLADVRRLGPDGLGSLNRALRVRIEMSEET